MIKFIIGFLLGGLFGVIIMSLTSVILALCKNQDNFLLWIIGMKDYSFHFSTALELMLRIHVLIMRQNKCLPSENTIKSAINFDLM